MNRTYCYMHSLFAEGNKVFLDQEDSVSVYNTLSPLPEKKMYHVELPYPKIAQLCRNERYLELILEDYAGGLSEMTTLQQYFYGYMMLRGSQYDEIAEAFKKISISEMRHLELLGETIKALGGALRFCSIQEGMPIYWTPDYIAYPKDPQAIILESIEVEKESIKQYEAHCIEIEDSQTRTLLRRIILDEQLHVEILNDLYGKYFG